MAVFGIYFGVVIIGVVLGIRELINDNKFWKRQNYMSKIEKILGNT